MTEGIPEILKSIYQFDNFVTGPSNRLPFAAAKKVAENPGNIYNPLLIYGGVGLGKTHLIHAIGNMIAINNPAWNIVFLNGSQMVFEDMIAAEKSNLLLFDDLHLGLQDKKIQIRLLSLFDRMVGLGHQIVVTTDMMPQKINSIDEKLLSRLLGGLIVGLKEIDVNEKAMIISRKAKDRDVVLSDETTLIIASRVPSNIRELEGALNKVLLHASLSEGPLTKSVVDEALPPVQSPVIGELNIETPPEEEIIEQEPLSGEYGEFISGVDNKVSSLISEQQNADKLRNDYKEKLFVWKMKGFNTSSIEKILEQDISIVTEAYDRFTSNIEEMMNLQKEFGQLASQATQDEIDKIESLMFDPDKIEELIVSIKILSDKKQSVEVRVDSSKKEYQAKKDKPLAVPPKISQESPPEPRPILTKIASLTTDDKPENKAAGKQEILPTKVGIIEENWPILEDRLMEDI